MAKGKKGTKKTHHRRRHRIGALDMKPGSPIVKYGSMVLGYLAADMINQQLIDKMVGTPTDPVKTGKTIAVAQVGLGAALSFNLISKKKNLVTEILGGILIGSGAKRATVVFKAGATTMSGYGNVPAIGSAKKLMGYGNVPAIGAYEVPGQMGAYAPNSSLNGSKVMGAVTKTADCGCAGGTMTAGSGSTLVG